MSSSAERESPTIIITGCSGLIGEALIERLSDSHNIVGFDVKEPSRGDFDFVEIDLTSDDSVREGLEYVGEEYGEKIASVIHLAAFYDFSGEPSPKYDEITVQGTERLLRMLQPYDVEQFIFSSTMLVHKPCEPGEYINEDWPLEAKWPYPESKVETEELIRQRRGDIPALILRLAGAYDDQCNSLPLANQIDRIFRRRMTAHVYPGDTSRGQAFVHMDDLVDAFDRSVARRGELPEELTLLIGETEAVGYGEIQQILGREIHGEDWTTLRIPKPLARIGAWAQDKAPVGGDPFIKPFMIGLADDHYALDTSRAREHLDWQAQHNLRETLPKMARALEADPLGWYEAHDLEPPRFVRRKGRMRRGEQVGVGS